jgi:metacaspase-1
MAKRALLVGLNRYPDPANTLRGCLNDVRQLGDTLAAQLGFGAPGAISTLTDAEATTAAIRHGLERLVDGARSGDVVVFHYSGHGSQVEDRDGDESDGLDEIICPYDLDWDAPFTDDDLDAIVRRLDTGAVLAVILDCCHSGTGLRELAQRVPRYKARCLPHPGLTAGEQPAGGIRRLGRRLNQRGAVLLAGCRADQVSADALLDGDYHGALTFYLCRAITELGPDATYLELVRRVRQLLNREGFDQVPQLEGPDGLLRLSIFCPAVALSR